MSKYQAKRVMTSDGIWHDSKKEARRWEELLLLVKAGLIVDLQRQVRFVLIPTQREEDTIGKRGKRYPGKVIERELAYVADFVYWDIKQGKRIVEDVKGFRTPEYKIKRKLMLYIHNIRIVET